MNWQNLVHQPPNAHDNVRALRVALDRVGTRENSLDDESVCQYLCAILTIDVERPQHNLGGAEAQTILFIHLRAVESDSKGDKAVVAVVHNNAEAWRNPTGKMTLAR